MGAVLSPVPWCLLPSFTLSLVCIYSPRYLTGESYEILPQLEQRSSLPRSRCRSVAFALHQKWGEEVEGRQLKVLPRSQENRYTVLKCRNILLSDKKIFFFWLVQTVLALKTKSMLDFNFKDWLPSWKTNRKQQRIFTSWPGLPTVQHTLVTVQWEYISENYPFLPGPSGLSQNLWDLCSQRLSSGYGVGRFLRGSNGIHIKAMLLTGLSRQLRNKVSPRAVTKCQRAVNKNKNCFSSVGIGMAMTAISKNCPWEWIEKTVGPLLSYRCILPGTIPKHSLVSSCLSQKLFLEVRKPLAA